MADYCLEHYNEVNKTEWGEDEVWVEMSFCERCRDWELCVKKVGVKPSYLQTMIRVTNSRDYEKNKLIL